MTRRILVADEARRDLDAVIAQTETAFGARQASHYRALVQAALDRLAEPATDRIARPLSPDRPHLLRLALGGRSPHLLVYRVGPSGEVLLLRLLHHAMDLPRHVGGGEV